MVRTQIQLTEEQLERLRRESEREGVSLAELVRRSIDQTIGHGPAVSREALRRRAAELAGRFASGQSDVSADHDQHLEDAFRT